jgi:signal transduction histidine kinase
MNGILGMRELLLQTPLSDKQRKFAETVHRSGTALLEIINHILDYSEIEAGKLASRVFHSICVRLWRIRSNAFLLWRRARDWNLACVRRIPYRLATREIPSALGRS